MFPSISTAVQGNSQNHTNANKQPAKYAPRHEDFRNLYGQLYKMDKNISHQDVFDYMLQEHQQIGMISKFVLKPSI